MPHGIHTVDFFQIPTLKVRLIRIVDRRGVDYSHQISKSRRLKSP